MYHITDSMSVENMNLKRLLAHTKTKDQITAFLAQKMLDHSREHSLKLEVSWRNKAVLHTEM